MPDPTTLARNCKLVWGEMNDGQKKKFEANSDRMEKAIKKVYPDSGRHVPWSFIQSKLRKDLGEDVVLPNQQRIQRICAKIHKKITPKLKLRYEERGNQSCKVKLAVGTGKSSSRVKFA